MGEEGPIAQRLLHAPAQSSRQRCECVSNPAPLSLTELCSPGPRGLWGQDSASHPWDLGVGQVTGDQKSGMTPTRSLNVTGVSKLILTLTPVSSSPLPATFLEKPQTSRLLPELRHDSVPALVDPPRCHTWCASASSLPGLHGPWRFLKSMAFPGR